MRTKISNTPDKDAGKFLSLLFDEHKDEHIFILLSGGSAFSILEYISPSCFGPHVTICMADERFTYDTEGNNFSMLSQMPFYAQAVDAGATFISTLPAPQEPQHIFTQRIKSNIEEYIHAHPNCFSVGIFGVGEDGHTAGIFPAPESEFNSLYRAGDYYVALTHQNSVYPFRSTITPTFIEEVIDEVILYAVGKNKCENILDYMYNRTFEQHELPALIPASHPRSILFTDCPTLTP